MKRFTVVLVAALALPTLAMAQSEEDSERVTAGFNIGKPLPSGDFGDAFDGDISFAGHATVGVFGPLAIRGEIGQNKFKLKVLDTEAKLTNYSVGLQYGGYGSSGVMQMDTVRILPYVFAMIGSYKSDPGDGSDMGLALGGGINLRIMNNLGIQGDVHLHNVRAEDGDGDTWERYLTPSVGLYFTF